MHSFWVGLVGYSLKMRCLYIGFAIVKKVITDFWLAVLRTKRDKNCPNGSYELSN